MRAPPTRTSRHGKARRAPPQSAQGAPSFSPSPSHAGHMPRRERNEKLRGSGASKPSRHSGHARSRLRTVSSASSPRKITVPPPRSSARATRCLRSLGAFPKRQATRSMSCGT